MDWVLQIETGTEGPLLEVLLPETLKPSDVTPGTRGVLDEMDAYPDLRLSVSVVSAGGGALTRGTFGVRDSEPPRRYTQQCGVQVTSGRQGLGRLVTLRVRTREPWDRLWTEENRLPFDFATPRLPKDTQGGQKDRY